MDSAGKAERIAAWGLLMPLYAWQTFDHSLWAAVMRNAAKMENLSSLDDAAAIDLVTESLTHINMLVTIVDAAIGIATTLTMASLLPMPLHIPAYSLDLDPLQSAEDALQAAEKHNDLAEWCAGRRRMLDILQEQNREAARPVLTVVGGNGG